MLLPDTSALIDLGRLRLPDEPLVLSVVVYAELRFGIHAAPNPEIRRQRSARLAWIRDTLDAAWLPFDSAAAESSARLAARVAPHRPQHARSEDIMIAGHAVALGAKLLTLNPKDFALIGDEVEIVVPELR